MICKTQVLFLMSTSQKRTRLVREPQTGHNSHSQVAALNLWKPRALRTPVLVFAIASCWSLIAVLQYLLTKSQRHQGVIFAPSINDLPLSRTFLYQYFPTVLAVIFSMFWAWIDLDTKRMEPYYQLSKKNGALAKDSLSLSYPFDFLPFVPLTSFKHR